jgi:hypothetical protein
MKSLEWQSLDPIEHKNFGLGSLVICGDLKKQKILIPKI